jgi:hypothetical protein
MTGLIAGLRRVAHAFFSRVVPSAKVSGLQVYFIDPDAPRSEICDALAESLNVLNSKDPRRRTLVAREVKHVIVWPGHYTAYTRIGGILLANDHVRDSSPAELVGLLVHEAVHLRIARLGVRYDFDRRARIERRCTVEQVDCLLRCSLISEGTAEKIVEALKTEWWSDSERRADLDLLMRKAGLPVWSARLLKGLT